MNAVGLFVIVNQNIHKNVMMNVEFHLFVIVMLRNYLTNVRKNVVIVTVQYQDIQKSTNYASGYALRFPRIKALRPDRGIDDIATVEEVRKEVGE